jgi:hypothetical protein
LGLSEVDEREDFLDFHRLPDRLAKRKRTPVRKQGFVHRSEHSFSGVCVRKDGRGEK